MAATSPSLTRTTARRRRLPAPVEAAPPPSRLDQLRAALLPTVDCLQRRRADLIDAALIEDFVDMNWMEWQGGSLKLTVTGQNICVQMQRARRAEGNG